MNRLLLPLFSILVMSLLPALVEAQRNLTYLDLISRADRQDVYQTPVFIPDANSDSMTYGLTFRINHRFLTFKKEDKSYRTGSARQGNQENYSAPIRVTFEVFRVPEDKFPTKNKKRKKRREALKELNLPEMESVDRQFWSDTAYTSNYQQTRTNQLFVQGGVQTRLAVGFYICIFEINQGSGGNNEYTRRIPIAIRPLDEMRNFPAHWVMNSKDGNYPLINMGNRVPYGKNFDVLFPVTDYSSSKTYSIKINRLTVDESDTTVKNSVYTAEINQDQFFGKTEVELKGLASKPVISVKSGGNSGQTYAVVNIPGKELPNDRYRLVVTDSENQQVMKTYFQSYWRDMPISLLNLDVAINMLRFILPEKKLEELKEGNFKNRRKKFEAFWKERDQTPDTEYNELMAEYYRRIDYAFREFGSIRVPGYQTDQGKVYIRHGKPASRDKKFPSNEPAVEIWEYPKQNLQFIFQATSGFGEYELISRKELK